MELNSITSRKLFAVAGVVLVIGCVLPWLRSPAGGTLALMIPYEASGLYWPRAFPLIHSRMGVPAGRNRGASTVGSMSRLTPPSSRYDGMRRHVCSDSTRTPGSVAGTVPSGVSPLRPSRRRHSCSLSASRSLPTSRPWPTLPFRRRWSPAMLQPAIQYSPSHVPVSMLSGHLSFVGPPCIQRPRPGAFSRLNAETSGFTIWTRWSESYSATARSIPGP